MSIKLMPNSTYRVSVHKRNPETGRPETLRRSGIKSRALAERTEKELYIKMGEYLHRKIVPTWGRFFEEYLKHIRINGLQESTIYNIEKNLRYHTMAAWSDTCLDNISTEDIFNLVQERLGLNKEAHRLYVLKCIRGVFAYALERQFVNKNPTPTIKRKGKEKIRPVLNEEQIVHLLRKAQEQDWHWYPHYAMALFTGLRSGELYALTWDKVDIEKRTIVVNCSWNSKNGFKSTKSGNDRILEIPSPLIPVLKELKLQSSFSEFVLPRLSKWDKGEQARELRFFLKSIGLPDVNFHALRASWATMLLAKGVAPAKVMSMGGWKNMETMMIYMRKAGIDIKGSTSVLDNMKTHGVESGKILTFG